MPRSEAPQDPRPYVRVSCDLPMNPKLDAIDNPAAGWAYVVSLCYCGQSLTDGHFPTRAVLRLANVDKDILDAIVEQGLWHLSGHDCERCEQPKPGHAVIHDYLRHQRSGDEARDLTTKRREAGRLGAQARWGSKNEHHPKPPPVASAIASAEQTPWQNDGKTMAEERRGEERRKGGARASETAASESPDGPPSPRCDRHSDDPSPPPCGQCADARRAREQWDRDRAGRAEAERAAAAATVAAERRAQAAANRAAIDACNLCDNSGYRGRRPCDHDPDTPQIGKQRAAEIRAQLAAKDVA